MVGADGLKSRLRSQLLGDGAPRHHGRSGKKPLWLKPVDKPGFFVVFFGKFFKKEPEDLGRNDLNLDEDLCRWGEHTN